MSFKMVSSVVLLILIASLTKIKGQNTPGDTSLNAISQMVEETLANLKYVQINWVEFDDVVQQGISRLQHKLQNALKQLNPQYVLKPLTAKIVFENKYLLLPLVFELNVYIKSVVSNHRLSKQYVIIQKSVEASTIQVNAHIQRLDHSWKDIPDSFKYEIERRKNEIKDIEQKLHLQITSGLASQGNIIANGYLIKTKLDALDTYIIHVFNFLDNQQRSRQIKLTTDLERSKGQGQVIPGQGQKKVGEQTPSGSGGKRIVG